MLHLMVEYFHHPFENRREEILRAIKNNIDCKQIDKISIFCEDVDMLKELLEDNLDKVEIIQSNHRMTYADYFKYCNNNFCENTVYMVANNDIYFDHTVAEFEKIKEDSFICLTRWNTYNNKIEIQGHEPYSQDVWVFRKRIPEDMINVSYFYQGTMCCDNHISFIAIVHGFNVINPCHLVKSYHLHEDAKEKTYNTDDREIDNLMFLSTVGPSDSIDYDPANVGSFFSIVSIEGRMCSDEYIDYIRNTYESMFKFKLLNYNKLKLKDKDKAFVKGVNY